MLNSVARRYIKAILQVWDRLEDLEVLLLEIQKLWVASQERRFQEIMQAPFLGFMEKQKVLLEVVDSKDKQVQNLFSLLLKNNRLDSIPYIYELLCNYISMQKKCYEGVIYSKENLGNEVLESIQEKLAHHLGVDLRLNQERSDKDGISLEVEGLGVEISFSQERFLDDLKSHILKAI